MQNKHGLIFVAQSKLIAFGKLGLFIVSGRCAFSRFCANDDQARMRLSSSRSFSPYQKLTQLVPFFEINSTVFFFGNIALDTIYRGLKVK